MMYGSNNGIADEAWSVDAHIVHSLSRRTPQPNRGVEASSSTAEARNFATTNNNRQNNALIVQAVQPETSPQSDNDALDDGDGLEIIDQIVGAAKQIPYNLK